MRRTESLGSRNGFTKACIKYRELLALNRELQH
jgi:hypothetical protein